MQQGGSFFYPVSGGIRFLTRNLHEDAWQSGCLRIPTLAHLQIVRRAHDDKRERRMTASFRWALKIGEGDIDELGHVNNVVYVRWIQETAEAHWMSLADEFLRSGLAWVVLRHEIDYRSAAMPEDEPYALTHVGETDGLRSIRHVDIHSRDGRLLVSARTTWCLLDTVSRKPRRIPDEVRRILQQEGR